MLAKLVCSKCGVEKTISNFYKDINSKRGFSYYCIECTREQHRKYYEENKDIVKQKRQRYRLDNLDKVREAQRLYYHTDAQKKYREDYAKKNAEHRKEYMREYRKKNAEHIRQKAREYYHNNKHKLQVHKKRYKDKNRNRINAQAKEYREKNRKKINDKRVQRLHSDSIFHMKAQIRGAIRDSLGRKNHRKSSHTADIVGCDLDCLCDYLFKTWEKNYGQPWNGEAYHIDHIVPLATAKTEEDIIKLCHYTNLQMLTPEDNMTKSDNI